LPRKTSKEKTLEKKDIINKKSPGSPLATDALPLHRSPWRRLGKISRLEKNFGMTNDS
jgi:hypothetical protein